MSDKKKLVIITQDYPYGELESSFIGPELMHLINSEKFQITIIANTQKNVIVVPELSKYVVIKSTKRKDLYQEPLKVLKYTFKYFFSQETAIEKREIYKSRDSIGKVIESLLFYIRAELFWEYIGSEKINLNDTIVYTYWNDIETLALALNKKKYKGTRLVSRIHGFDLFDERTRFGRQPFRKTVDEQLDKLFFIAQTGMDYYIDKMGESSRYFLKRLGVSNKDDFGEIQRSQQSHNSFLLVSCSNLIPLKRVDMIIEALSKIDDFNIQWIHFGDGYLRGELEKKAKDLLQQKQNIEYSFIGQIKNLEICNFYRNNRVDCFITTSQTEGCPVSIQEAMSYGIPIIGTSVGEIPIMIEENGVLLSCNPNQDEVTEAIKKIRRLSTEEAESCRVASRNLWEKYFNEKNCYREFLEELIWI